MPAAIATTLILHDNSVVGSDTRLAPPQVTVRALATERCARLLVKVRVRLMTPTCP